MFFAVGSAAEVLNPYFVLAMIDATETTPMNVGIILTRAGNGDRDQAKALIYGVLREYGLQKPDPAKTDRDLEDIEAHYPMGEGFFGILKDPSEARIIATVAIRRVDRDTCELRKMYLAPAWRGQGIGKQLLACALTKARALGYRRITLETASVLKEATTLYESYGFTEYVPDELPERCDKAFELCLDTEKSKGST